MKTVTDSEIAKTALEEVCARGDFEAARSLYSPQFIDHVNDLDFTGHDGIEQSVGLYHRVLKDLLIVVQDQVTEGDRVVSRWVAHGSNRGRQVELKGITISRLIDGKIAEDWTISDNVSLLRQLGLIRSALVGVGELTAWLRSRRSR